MHLYVTRSVYCIVYPPPKASRHHIPDPFTLCDLPPRPLWGPPRCSLSPSFCLFLLSVHLLLSAFSPTGECNHMLLDVFCRTYFAQHDILAVHLFRVHTLTGLGAVCDQAGTGDSPPSGLEPVPGWSQQSGLCGDPRSLQTLAFCSVAQQPIHLSGRWPIALPAGHSCGQDRRPGTGREPGRQQSQGQSLQCGRGAPTRLSQLLLRHLQSSWLKPRSRQTPGHCQLS